MQKPTYDKMDNSDAHTPPPEEISLLSEETTIVQGMDLNATPLDNEHLNENIGDLNDKIPPVETLSEVNTSCEPYVGMVFDTLEASKLFWDKYGRISGFSTKIRSTNRSKKNREVIDSRDYACSQEGKNAKDDRCATSKRRPDTRCGCLCSMKIRLIKDTHKFKVTSFIKEHTHPLAVAVETPYLRSNRKITDIQAKAIDNAEAAGIGPKTTYRYMSLLAGGPVNVGFVSEDIKSYLRTRRQKNLKLGEANSILEYFREKKRIFPSFFHDYQYDCKGKLTNIFWADSKMLVDYQAFGDVVMFDTTFGTNKATRPLGIFTGFNNHTQCVVFGGCLLFDETIPSFAWTFKVFLECHGGKKPIIMFTDQDAAMSSAMEVAMPSVRHCLCSWHIIQNATKNLQGKLEGKFSEFLKDFKSCMYTTCGIENFEQKWNDMVRKYDMMENSWFHGLHGKKEKWSVAYRMNIFSAGVRSTQLVECVNGKLKKELGTGITMRKFFKGFDNFLDSVRERERKRERKSDFQSKQPSPHLPVLHSKILKHAALVYTPQMFLRFSNEFDKMHGILLDEMNLVEGPHVRKGRDGDMSFRIDYDPISSTISCSCCMFEMQGYLCAHILRVFDVCGIPTIPEKYIMKRWTRQARSGLAIVPTHTPKLSNAENVAMVMSNFSRLAYLTKGNQIYVDRIMKFIVEEEEFIGKHEMSETNGSEGNLQSDHEIELMHSQVTGLKRKECSKGRKKKRERSCLEKSKRAGNIQTKKRKTQDQPSFQVSMDHLINEDDLNLCLKI